MIKKVMSCISAAVLSLGLLIPSVPASAFTYETDQLEEYAMQVVDLVNQEREKASAQDGKYRAPLQLLEPLSEAAQVRAREQKDVYGHTRPDGTSWDTVLAEFNIAHGRGAWGENCYKRINTPEAAMTGWINSPGHYQNMIDPRYNYIGVGVAKINGIYYWTQDFLTEYRLTNLPAPSAQSLNFNKNGLTNPFTVRATHYEPDQSSFVYSMCFSVADESSKTAIFHGVSSKRVERVEVPKTVKNPTNGKTYTVVGIGDTPGTMGNNLPLRQHIRYLVVPNSVLSISERAFYSGDLVSVRVEAQNGQNGALRFVGKDAFAFCENLLSIGFQTCPYLASIQENAFNWCDNLSTITFSPSATDITFASQGKSPFSGDKITQTILYIPNHTNTAKTLNIFSTDAKYFRNGLLKVYSGKGYIFENYTTLRAQNTTSTLKHVTPIA